MATPNKSSADSIHGKPYANEQPPLPVNTVTQPADSPCEFPTVPSGPLRVTNPDVELGPAPVNSVYARQAPTTAMQKANAEARRQARLDGRSSFEDSSPGASLQSEIAQGAISEQAAGQSANPPPVNPHQQQSADPQSANPKIVNNSSKKSIEVLVENLALRMSNEFLRLHNPAGDTLIYIGVPPRLGQHSQDDYNHIKSHFDRIIQVDSSALKTLGSNKFGIGEGQLLGPGACMRAKRRFKKLEAYNKLEQGVRDNIKYHVDLRPPSEDDDAVLLLTDLTCTRGVRTWYLAKGKYQLSPQLVLGVDELDTDSNPYNIVFRDGNVTGDQDVTGNQDVTGDQDVEGASNRIEAKPVVNLSVSDLCPLRQHSAVERMLQAIYGNDPMLDSAPKVWAFFVTAKFYDCAHHSNISKWIEKWLYADKNAAFIQNNPEVAYRIGMGCRLEHLTKDAFSILVGEKALLDVASELSGQAPSSERSIHGREFEVLDDDERNRISHAASSLIRRVRSLYQPILIDRDWLKDCTEYQRLLAIKTESRDQKERVETAALRIREFCADRIKTVVSRNIRMPFVDLDRSASNTGDFRNGSVPDFETTFNNLRAQDRPLARTFWIAVQRAQFQDGDASNSVAGVVELAIDGPTQMIEAKSVSIFEVQYAINRVNDFLWSRHRYEVAARSGQALAIRSPKRQGENAAEPTGASPSKRRKAPDSSEQTSPQISFSTMQGETAAMPAPNADLSSIPEVFEFEASESADSFWTDLQFRNRQAPKSAAEPDPWAQFPPPPKPTIDRGDKVLKPQLSKYEAKKDEETGQSVFRMKPNAVEGYSSGRILPSPWQDQGWAADPSVNLHQRHVPDNASMHVHFQDYRDGTVPNTKPRVMQQFSDTAPSAGWLESHETLIHQTPMGVKLFEKADILGQMSAVLSRRCEDIVDPAHLFHDGQQTPIDLADTLVCLADEEWKFLPLWAGGLDDGEGGVFNEVDVPNDDAAGFQGGKRGIKNAGHGGEGSVSGSEDSFDDIASEAMSTVGKASKYATDGTATVKSLSENGTMSDDGFMNQDDVYAAVQALSMEKMDKGKGKHGDVWVPGDQFDFDQDEMAMDDDDDDGDASTVMGAGSDIQGQFFGNDMNDGDDQVGLDDSEDDDMEVIDMKLL